MILQRIHTHILIQKRMHLSEVIRQVLNVLKAIPPAEAQHIHRQAAEVTGAEAEVFNSPAALIGRRITESETMVRIPDWCCRGCSEVKTGQVIRMP